MSCGYFRVQFNSVNTTTVRVLFISSDRGNREAQSALHTRILAWWGKDITVMSNLKVKHYKVKKKKKKDSGSPTEKTVNSFPGAIQCFLSKALHDISMLSYSSHREQFGDQYLAKMLSGRRVLPPKPQPLSVSVKTCCF